MITLFTSLQSKFKRFSIIGCLSIFVSVLASQWMMEAVANEPESESGNVILGQVVEQPSADGNNDFLVLVQQQACRSGTTKSSGLRRSCTQMMRIDAPNGYRLDGDSATVVLIGSKGSGLGCRGPGYVIDSNHSGNQELEAVVAQVHARSEREDNNWDGGALGGVASTAATVFFEELGNAGAATCELSVRAERIEQG